MYCVVVAFKMTEQVEQWICIKFCVKLEHSSAETLQMIQKTTGMSNWWWATSSQQCTRSLIMSYAEFFDETLNYPGDSATLQHRFGNSWLLAFPQTKNTFDWKRRDFRSSGRFRKMWRGSWWWLEELCEYFEGEFFEWDYFEWDWGIIVLCTMFILSFIFNKCLYITWLDTF